MEDQIKMKKNEYVEDIEGIEGIVFSSKAESVPYKYRISYKIAVCSLIIKMCCRGRGCSVTKLHLINNYMYSKNSKIELLNYVENKENSLIILRYDPTVTKTLKFMHADKIIEQQQNGCFRLTEKGKKFSEDILSEENILIDEKIFLTSLAGKLTEKIITNIEKSLLG